MDCYKYLSILQAVDALNGSEVKTCKLYVARAQKKNERQAELREKYEKLKMERLNRYQQGKKDHKFFICWHKKISFESRSTRL